MTDKLTTARAKLDQQVAEFQAGEATRKHLDKLQEARAVYKHKFEATQVRVRRKLNLPEVGTIIVWQKEAIGEPA